MSVRRRRAVAVLRVVTVAGVLAGILLTALGPATVTGLLPYFTIQSNVAVGLLAGYAAWRAWRERPEPPAVLTGAVTLYITITGVVYHLVLANPASPFAVAQPDRAPGEALGNQLLHTVVPLLALTDWALFDRRGRMRLRHAAWWLAFPLAYLAFALLRGLVVHGYPYPFLDAGELGYGGVALVSVLLAMAFWLLGVLLVGADRALARRAGTATPEPGRPDVRPGPGPQVGERRRAPVVAPRPRAARGAHETDADLPAGPTG
ncbi:Pr6Pr family membrane protein [Micromonospora sp. URMC 103]|uniref:Pr6Pr family membrane protein n=1 Tax=Micromonospora sp. URMC 103 TaxID=3423406 RepID=UPI003F1D0D34